MAFLRGVSWLVPLISAVLPAFAGEAVRVYTNADLERLEPMTASSSDVATGDDPAGWTFVVEFIERQRRLLDQDRAHEPERYGRDTGAVEGGACRRGILLPLGYGRSTIGGFGGRSSRSAPPAPAEPRPGVDFSKIVPLHARRPLAARP